MILLSSFFVNNKFSDQQFQGCLIKPNTPSSNVCSKRFGLDHTGCYNLRVSCDWCSKQQHNLIGNRLTTPQRPAINQSFHVNMTSYVVFILCMCGRTNCNSTACSLSKVFRAYEASLSSYCVAGMKPLADRD